MVVVNILLLPSNGSMVFIIRDQITYVFLIKIIVFKEENFDICLCTCFVIFY